MDLKTLRSALDQLAEERNISQDKILGAIEDALVAAYKKDTGKKGQIIRAKFDPETGLVNFYQIKIVVAPETLLPTNAPENLIKEGKHLVFNEEQHILSADAQKIKRDIQAGEELIFPLETRSDYGRIAAQTAKQVIIQRIREAEKESVLKEYAGKIGQIISGKVQKLERGNVFVDLGRAVALLPYEEQIPGERYNQGERVRAYLTTVEETPRGVNLRLSRSHPKFLAKLFELETPEIASGLVEIRAIAREPGLRSKIAVLSNRPNIDPVGACVGQRGIRVNTVVNELGGEKIDIVEWLPDPAAFIKQALSPAKISQLNLDKELERAEVTVEPDQFSLAVGKKGQNVRLAAKLTGWQIDIKTPEGEPPEEAIEKTETS